MSDEIGRNVIVQIQKAMQEKMFSFSSPNTAELIRGCMDAIEIEVEKICPAVLSPVKGGVITAYGPLLNGNQATNRHLFIMGGNIDGKAVAISGLSEWGPEDYPKELEEVGKGAWGMVCEFLHEHEPKRALMLIKAIIVKHRKEILEEMAAIAKSGNTPAFCAVTALNKKTNKVAGLTCVVVLPPSVDLLLMEEKGTS